MYGFNYILVCCSTMGMVTCAGLKFTVKKLDIQLADCPSIGKTPWYGQLTQLDILPGNKATVSGWATFDEGLPAVLEVRAIVKRCEIANPRKCSTFASANKKVAKEEICEQMEKHKDERGAKAVQPNAHCPIKGTYRLANFTDDIKTAGMMPGIDKWIWKSRSQALDASTNKTLSCQISTGRIYLE